MKTKTIFRTFKRGGDVIALFPEIPNDHTGHYCESYMHIGQHGGAYCVPDHTRPSTPEEIAPLRAELESLGYEIQEIKRTPSDAYRKRLESIRAIA